MSTLLALSWLAACTPIDQIDLTPEDTFPDVVDTPDTDVADTVDTTQVTLPIPFCINEIMAQNKGSFTLPSGETPDWFELYNPGSDPVALDGWTVSDSLSPEVPDPLDGLILPPGGFLVLYADAAVDVGERHLSFELSDGGDLITILAPDGRRMTVNFPASAWDMAFARTADCCEGECWGAVPYGTPTRSNSGL